MEKKKEVKRVRKDWNLRGDIQNIHGIMKRETPETESEVMTVFGNIQKANALLVLGKAQEVSEIVSGYLAGATESEALRKEEREKAYTAILARLDGIDFLNGKIKEGQDAIGDDTEKAEKFNKKLRTVAVILTKLLDGKSIVNETKEEGEETEVEEVEVVEVEGKVETSAG